MTEVLLTAALVVAAFQLVLWLRRLPLRGVLLSIVGFALAAWPLIGPVGRA